MRFRNPGSRIREFFFKKRSLLRFVAAAGLFRLALGLFIHQHVLSPQAMMVMPVSKTTTKHTADGKWKETTPCTEAHYSWRNRFSRSLLSRNSWKRKMMAISVFFLLCARLWVYACLRNPTALLYNRWMDGPQQSMDLTVEMTGELQVKSSVHFVVYLSESEAERQCKSSCTSTGN